MVDRRFALKPLAVAVLAASALVAQVREPLAGILAAVYLHGLAGDLAASHRGESGMLASDLLDHIPEAIRIIRGDVSLEP